MCSSIVQLSRPRKRAYNIAEVDQAGMERTIVISGLSVKFASVIKIAQQHTDIRIEIK